MNVCFMGDLFLGGDLKDVETKKIVDSEVFLNADLRIVNLEQPISDNSYVEDKCTLFTSSYAIQQLRDLNIDAVNLAHNHIQDKGQEGISETIQHLETGSVGHFGAGNDIVSAKRPYWLSEDVALLGYCEFDKPYLKQIEVAGENKAGINPLRLKNILQDLESLPLGKEVVLYFHWGKEHVWLPPHDDIILAKKLLEHEKVRLILGMHAHRVQGFIEHNGKRAYMCLGNFLFPNFHIAPPTQIYYPTVSNQTYDVTRQYHAVSEITYKKWRFVNRVSLIVRNNLETNMIEHYFVVQDDDRPLVRDATGLQIRVFSLLIWVLNILYKLPKWIYTPLEKISSKLTSLIWRMRNACFYIKQMGIGAFIKKNCWIIEDEN